MGKIFLFLFFFFTLLFLSTSLSKNTASAACYSQCVSLYAACPDDFPEKTGNCIIPGAPAGWNSGQLCCTADSYTCEPQSVPPYNAQECKSDCSGVGEREAAYPGGTCPGSQKCCYVPLEPELGDVVAAPCGGDCSTINTAFGSISTNPEVFIKDILKLVLAFSGGIIILLLISAGYRLMVSQGDPEKIKEARESITSAVLGLFFIIFSFVLYNFITNTVLNLPGFN